MLGRLLLTSVDPVCQKRVMLLVDVRAEFFFYQMLVYH
jgi:hypothetical protein